MAILHDQIEQALPGGMRVPEPLRLLFDWIEDNGLYIDQDNWRSGYLHPQERLRVEWTVQERPGGTDIEFKAEGNLDLKYWFGHQRLEVLNRLCVFAKTGAEGSMAAFWLDDDGMQRIVHLGSGSGSLMTCVLADDAIDFLRLIAIGYDEICWNLAFSEPPNAGSDSGALFVHPNREYQDWVTRTFSVSIPRTAKEIVSYPDDLGGPNTRDPFNRWVGKSL
jgi:hypothetical protein